jgi:hypothetical protein
LFDIALELLPVTFDAIPVHFVSFRWNIGLPQATLARYLLVSP